MEITSRISTAPTQPARDSYADYLHSPTWRKRRDQKLCAVGWHCERCQTKRVLQVHHKCYQRLGEELDSDLEVLCRSCHEQHHHREGATEHIGLYVQLAADVVQGGARFQSEAALIDALKYRCAQAKIPYNTERLIRAAQIVIGKRRGIIAPAPIQARLNRGEDVEPPNRLEAESLLRQLGIKVAIRSIPNARHVTQHDADRAKAMKFVAQEIVDSIARCEALEAVIQQGEPQDDQAPTKET